MQLSTTQYHLTRQPDTLQLQDIMPTAGERLSLQFTRKHDASSLTELQQDAVFNLAAALVYDQLAQQNTGSTAAEYKIRVNAHRQYYDTAIQTMGGTTANLLPFDFGDMLSVDEQQLQGNAGLQRAVEAALEQYSVDFPCEVIEDITTPTPDQFNLPARWVDGFSEVAMIESPVGCRLAAQQFYICREPTFSVLKIVNLSTASIRLTFTVKRSWESVPAQHRRAVMCLATSVVCENLATLKASNTESLIAADGVNRSTQSSNFSRRAADLRKRYTEITDQVQRPETAPASAMVNLNTRTGHERGRMFRGR